MSHKNHQDDEILHDIKLKRRENRYTTDEKRLLNEETCFVGASVDERGKCVPSVRPMVGRSISFDFTSAVVWLIIFRTSVRK